MEMISTNFSLDKNEFSKEFHKKLQNKPECAVIKIKNIPNIQKGLELITQQWFSSIFSKHQEILSIFLRTNEPINKQYQILDNGVKLPMLIAFQSTLGKHESKTFWKTKDREKFYSLFIHEDQCEKSTPFCHEFLINEIKNGNSGILADFVHKNKVRLQELGDNEGNNLLIIASIKNLTTPLMNLLQYEFDIDYENILGENAIDWAWKNYCTDENFQEESDKIILCLLSANSKFPKDFDYIKASKDVQKFVDMCENLHAEVEVNSFKEIKPKLDEHPNLIHYYDRNNKSLLTRIFEIQKEDMLTYLDTGITVGSHEDLSDIYDKFKEGKSTAMSIKQRHQINAAQLPENHLLMLRIKSKIGNNDHNSIKHWKYIENAFKVINSNKFCSKILKIAATCKTLRILFDFKHHSTYYLDPTSSINTRGNVYSSGLIYIGAKELLDDDTKYEIYGVLAHELCHLAVSIAFMNSNFDPFPEGESEEKFRFIDIVMKECKDNEEFEELVSNVGNYPENYQPSEMIVTIAQMLMQYFDDKTRIEELQNVFPELFKYSKEVVEPELDRALPVLQILDDESKKVKFEDLTEPMKAKILHSKVNFQGEETSFFKIIGDDHNIIKSLNSKGIRDILIQKVVYKLGEICKLNLGSKMIERTFYDSKIDKNLNDNQNPQHQRDKIFEFKQTFEDIQVDVKKSKIFLLVDKAGTGKTTSFIDAAAKLKKIYTNSWVTFISLRKHENVFEKFKKKTPNLNFNNIIDILLQIVDQNSEIKAQIFQKLFSENKVILLFDGFDEISPKYSELLTKLFRILKTKGCAELWISSRPFHVKKLENIFGVSAFKFAPYSEDDTKRFIGSLLEIHNVIDEAEQTEITNQIFNYMENLNNKAFKFQKIEDPFMIKIITELFIKKSLKIDLNCHYELYAAMVEKHKEEFGGKISTSEVKDLKLTIWDVHRVLALKVIIDDNFEDDLGFKLDALSIMKRWKRVKRDYTSEMIQRYGFVTVDLDYENMSIDFTHRTYAEFFVAQFFIDFMFDNFDDVVHEEIERKFKIFDGIMGDKWELDVARNFMLSFVENKKLKFDEKIRKLIIHKLQKINENLKNSEESSFVYHSRHLENYSKFTHNDIEMRVIIWGCNQNPTFFNNLLSSYENFVSPTLFYHNKDFKYTLEFIELHFGTDWHLKFNKNGEDLIADEEYDRLYSQNGNDWEYRKSVLKLYEFIDKNFKDEDKKCLDEKFELFYADMGVILKDLIAKF